MRVFSSRLLSGSCLATALLAIIAGGPRDAWAVANPPGCSETGPILLLRELRDLDGMTNPGDNGPGETPISGFKIEGETIYYEARLTYTGAPQCGYEGGTICIDPPGGGAVCPDVTPVGGVPLLCADPACSPSGVGSVKSKQLAYVVHIADAEPVGQNCAGQVRAFARYRNGTSHFTTDVFPVDADTPICNPVQTPTPTATPTRTPTPTATPTNVAPLHFACYEVHHGPFTQITVSLLDALGMSTGTLEVPKRLCNPADKNDENPPAPGNQNHLAGYKLKLSPAFQKRRDVVVTNQFGSVVVDVVKPELLMVPGAKDLVAPPAPIVPTVDHYTCYKVSRGQFRRSGVKVDDQFVPTTNIDIKKPVRLCLPTNKNGGGVIAPTLAELCYKVRNSPGFPKFTGVPQAFVNNQFRPDVFAVFGLREFCVPSTVLIP